MVISELAGGLGNQLFQYAFGLATAKRNKTDLYLDLRFLERRDHQGPFTVHDYALDVFDIKAKKLEKKDYAKADRLKRTLKSRLFRKTLVTFSDLVQEDSKRYRRDYLKLRAPVFLSGFWQNPRYFREFEDEIRRDLHFIAPWSGEAFVYHERIHSAKVPVSLHIRRGDYLRYPNLKDVCSADYYRKSLEHIAKVHPKITVFVFSDEPEWVKEKLQLPYETIVVEHHSREFKDYEDLRLMAECHHHVIANSSFSWWGAWLGKKPGQIVCAPSSWDGKRRVQDIVDEGWTII